METETISLVRRILWLLACVSLAFGVLGVFVAGPVRNYRFTLIIVGIGLATAGWLSRFMQDRDRHVAEVIERSGAPQHAICEVTGSPAQGLAAAPSEDRSSDQPWLKNEQWVKREMVDQRGLGLPVLALAYLVGAGIAAGAVATIRESRTPALSWDMVTSVSAFFLLLVTVTLAILTCMWLRRMRYGRSVCRLITLPGVVDGWFKADVECGLPPGTGLVTVRLKNCWAVRYEHELWRMEQTSTPVAQPGDPSRRSIIPIRLRVPRHRSQEFNDTTKFSFGAPTWGGVFWKLEVEKKAPGINFFALFYVPIYDTRAAPAAEQQPG